MSKAARVKQWATEPLVSSYVVSEPDGKSIVNEFSSLPLTPSQDAPGDYMWMAKSLANYEVPKLQAEGWVKRGEAPFAILGYPEQSVYFFCKRRE